MSAAKGSTVLQQPTTSGRQGKCKSPPCGLGEMCNEPYGNGQVAVGDVYTPAAEPARASPVPGLLIRRQAGLAATCGNAEAIATTGPW